MGQQASAAPEPSDALAVPEEPVEIIRTLSPEDMLKAAEPDQEQKDYKKMALQYGTVVEVTREKRERKVRRLHVKGAGLAEVNGIYAGKGKFAGGILFEKDGGSLGKVYIRRQDEEAGIRNWRITLSDSAGSSNHLYKRDKVSEGQSVPPPLGWEKCTREDGVAEAYASKLGSPPEKIDVFHMELSKMNIGGDGDNKEAAPFSPVLSPLTDKDAKQDRFSLEVCIVSASNLHNADWGGRSDPYCVCSIPGKQPPAGSSRLCTEVIDDDLNPVWRFRALMPGYEVGDNLDFEVFDEDVGQQADKLGRFTLVHEEFFPTGGYSGEPNLLDEQGEAMDAKIELKVQLIKEAGMSQTQQRKKKVCRNLRVAIISASSLRTADLIGGADPYCICTIPGKTPEDDPPGRSVIESHVVPRTTSPVWHYCAEMPGYDDGDDFFFQLWDKDWGKEDDFLGQVSLKGDRIDPAGFIGELPVDEAGDAKDATLSICIIPPNREVPGIRCRFNMDEGKLGIRIVPDTEGDAFYIRKIAEGGLVHKWNTENPEKRIKIDDRVVEINGARGSTHDLMSTVAVCTGLMEWLVVRPIV